MGHRRDALLAGLAKFMRYVLLGLAVGWAAAAWAQEEGGAAAPEMPEAPPAEFDLGRPALLPGPDEPASAHYKPGHWTAVRLPVAANWSDFLGQLRMTAVDPKGRPLPLPGVALHIATTREAVIPKGQRKTLASLLLIPDQSSTAAVACRLWSATRGGQAVDVPGGELKPMPSYQYHMVVLARQPSRYGFLKTLPAVDPPTGGFEAAEPYYRVCFFPGDRPVGLPSSGLLYSSIAHVVWDDAEPDVLDAQQQQALVDWLHFGGRLIVSGPDSLYGLRDSFLEPYLPIMSHQNRQLQAADFEPLHDWSTAAGKPTPAFRPTRPLAGAAFRLHPHADYVPGSGRLMVERRIGRGRVVVTAFRLAESELLRWPGFDEMVNAFLLGHPPRRFYELDPPPGPPDAQPTEPQPPEIHVEWATGRPRLDAAVICPLRYFTRDTGVAWTDYGADVAPASAELSALVVDAPSAAPGMAAWNDFNAAASAARETLLEATRVKLPGRGFVAWLVLGYLVVLVPGNWLVFRMAGRVEYAWVAVPVIAVGWAALVVLLTQVDLGLGRAHAELTIVELQGKSSRALVTRYTSLYSSLAAQYRFTFDEADTLAAPFPSAAEPGKPSKAAPRTVEFRQGEKPRLEYLPVPSNATGLLHSEQMVALPGPLSLIEALDGLRLTNRTGLKLRDVGIVRRLSDADAEQPFEAVWLGKLDPDDVVEIEFEPLSLGPGQSLWALQRRTSRLTGPRQVPGNPHLGRLYDLPEHLSELEPGEVRLLAAIVEPIDGMTIEPEAVQTERVQFLLAHPRYAAGSSPQPDENRPPPPPIGISP